MQGHLTILAKVLGGLQWLGKRFEHARPIDYAQSFSTVRTSSVMSLLLSKSNDAPFPPFSRGATSLRL